MAAADVTRFVLRECRRGYGVSFAKNLVTALRSLLRYLHVEGVGQVLRHRSLTTTAIYAKVDRAAPASLALPWPEGTA